MTSKHLGSFQKYEFLNACDFDIVYIMCLLNAIVNLKSQLWFSKHLYDYNMYSSSFILFYFGNTILVSKPHVWFQNQECDFKIKCVISNWHAWTSNHMRDFKTTCVVSKPHVWFQNRMRVFKIKLSFNYDHH